MLPDSLQNLIFSLERLPGVGPKTASRLAFYLLRAPEDLAAGLAEALTELKTKTAFCSQCFHITSAGREYCEICDSPQRDANLICVVEEPLDVLALERTGAFKGKYHVLQGVLSPIEGIGPDDLKIKALLERLKQGVVKEVILATDSNTEGEATALYIAKLLRAEGVKTSRIASGIPVGANLEHADQATILRAFEGRTSI